MSDEAKKWKQARQLEEESELWSLGGEVVAFKSQQAAIQVGSQDQKGTGLSSTWAQLRARDMSSFTSTHWAWCLWY